MVLSGGRELQSVLMMSLHLICLWKVRAAEMYRKPSAGGLHPPCVRRALPVLAVLVLFSLALLSNF